MCAFASDRILSEEDLQGLHDAVEGDLAALTAICQRSEIPILAAAWRATGDMAEALELVRPTLDTLCKELLRGELDPGRWPRRVHEIVDQPAAARASRVEAASGGLTGMSVVPRVARIRAVRVALPRLTQAQLTAVLMQYCLDVPPSAMVGLVADDERQAAEILEQAMKQLDSVVAEFAPQD